MARPLLGTGAKAAGRLWGNLFERVCFEVWDATLWVHKAGTWRISQQLGKSLQAGILTFLVVGNSCRHSQAA